MKTAEQVADLVPGVGATLGVDDTKNAAQRGDYTEAVVNGLATALGEIPGGGDVAAGVTKAVLGGIGKKITSQTSKVLSKDEQIFVIHGGSDFDDVDFSKLGSGEPGNIRPLGKGLYGFVVDPKNPEEAKRAIAYAKHYAQKYGKGNKKVHVFSVPKNATTRFNGKQIEGFSSNFSPQEEAVRKAFDKANKLPVGPERTKAFDEAHALDKLAETNPTKVQMKGERLPVDLTELSVLDKDILKRISKFDLDAGDEDILKSLLESK